jgi:hypothetical protein
VRSQHTEWHDHGIRRRRQLEPDYAKWWRPYAPTDGGILSIDPTRLPRDPYNNCAPVYPWNFIRANTIYGVIHAAGGYTVWADKHAVYAAVSGAQQQRQQRG